MTEQEFPATADWRAPIYAASVGDRPPYPDTAALDAFDEPFDEGGRPDAETLRLLDRVGGPATAVANEIA